MIMLASHLLKIVDSRAPSSLRSSGAAQKAAQPAQFVKRPMKAAIIAFAMSWILSGCGEGYVLPSGKICVRAEGSVSRDRVFFDVSHLLINEEGFEDFGRDDEMIELINRGHSDTLKAEMITRLRREHTYLNDKRGLRVIVTDYSGIDLSSVRLGYEAPYKSFVELTIYESRPGGFSSNGHAFFKKTLTYLQATYLRDVAVIKEPPPINDTEFKRVTQTNRLAAITWWIVAISILLLIMAPPLTFIVKKLSPGTLARRALFVLLATWLLTPLPTPTAIVVLLAPNVLLFPWTDLAYYRHIHEFALYSFMATGGICSIVSMLLFRKRQGHVGNA